MLSLVAAAGRRSAGRGAASGTAVSMAGGAGAVREGMKEGGVGVEYLRWRATLDALTEAVLVRMDERDDARLRLRCPWLLPPTDDRERAIAIALEAISS
mmetsp:Transcript_5837/g.16577  ORF Transcript_5837/g.16577 Transcript_5837/m.16577 type:complete len:99 (-) Transcript_5837:1298-1594(-)